MKLNKLEQLIEMGIRVELDENGQPIIYSPKGKVLKQFKTSKGYLQVSSYFKGKKENMRVHRISYIWFKGDIPEGLEIDHINRVRHDNRPANLQVLTHQENIDRVYKIYHQNYDHGKRKRPVLCSNGKEYETMKSASEDTGIGIGWIYQVCNGLRKSARGLTFEYKED